MNESIPGENALERWRGDYVALLTGGQFERPGRIEAVGRDGIIFQPLDDPRQTKDLDPQLFYPWHEIRHVRLRVEHAEDR